MKSNYQKLQIWQKSFQLSLEIYEVTKDFPKEEIFGLTSQMRRSAVSIPSNIAEGAGRNTKKDFAHFLSISKSSANELETQILIAEGLKYIGSEKSEKLQSDIQEILRMITKFIQNLSSTN